DDLALPLLLIAVPPRAVRRHHRPGQPTRADRTRRGPAPLFLEHAGDWRSLLGAVAVRACAGGAHGGGDRGAPSPLPSRGAELCALRLKRVQLGTVAGCRAGRAGAPGPRQAYLLGL